MTTGQLNAMNKLTTELQSAKAIGASPQSLASLANKGLIRRKSYYRCGYTYIEYALKSAQ